MTLATRPALLRRGLRLEYLTVGWNLVEGAISIAAALTSGSVALLGFGIDSFVESASGAVNIWRLRAEGAQTGAEAIESLERRAGRLVGLSLFGLAAFVVLDALKTLIAQERPEPSAVGIAVTGLSLSLIHI